MSGIFNRIRFHIFKWFKPVMLGRYRGIENTRVSNTTHIGNPESLTLGENVFIGHYNFIDASNGVVIEEGCQITNYISILTHSSHVAIRLYGKQYSSVPESEKVAYFRESVRIGKYSFVGPHSVIMPGTKLGKGCIVTAFSYVKGEFEDFAIIGGNPARVIGDTRDMDEPFLKENPELRKLYSEWIH